MILFWTLRVLILWNKDIFVIALIFSHNFCFLSWFNSLFLHFLIHTISLSQKMNTTFLYGVFHVVTLNDHSFNLFVLSTQCVLVIWWIMTDWSRSRTSEAAGWDIVNTKGSISLPSLFSVLCLFILTQMIQRLYQCFSCNIINKRIINHSIGIFQPLPLIITIILDIMPNNWCYA